MAKKILQIESIEAANVLARLDTLAEKIDKLEKQLSTKQIPVGYLSRKQVSEMFGVSLVTVHDWVNKGILTAYKVASRVYFKSAEIESALIEVKVRHINK